MSGGSCLDFVLQLYKSLQFGFLAKQLPLRDVSGIGVFLNKYRSEERRVGKEC